MRPYLELIRLPAVFTAPADVLAGLALATVAFNDNNVAGLASLFTGGIGVSPARMLMLLAASACVYCAGMAANDIFDAKVDAQERPGRPIPSGRVSMGRAWGLVLGLQGIALGLALPGGAPMVGAVGLTIGMTYLYNAVLKDGPAGPWAMGGCRMANAWIGLSVLGWPAPTTAWLIPLGTAVYVVGLTLTSRHEVDGTQPAALRLPFAIMLGGVCLPAVWALTVLPQAWTAALVILPLLWLIRPMHTAWQSPSAGAVRGVVMAGIFAIAMVNGCIAAACGTYGLALVAVGLLIPGKAVGRWFYAT